MRAPHLTPGGIGAAETALGPGLDAIAELFGGLSLTDQQHYLKALGQLLDAMGTRPDAAGSPGAC